MEGIEPTVRERAEAAARRAGLTLNEWLNSTVGEPASRPHDPAEVAEIHQRLDSISRQIEQMTQATATPRREAPSVTGQLNDAISRLDARLSQLSSPPPRPAAPPPQVPAAEPPRQAATIPELLRFDVAEILARQTELNQPPRVLQPSAAPPLAPQVAAPDLSGFERQLQYLTTQIEGLRRPDGVEQAIAAFRSELAEMRQAITDAVPRRALESLENEIRAVARRIDESRQGGADDRALHSIEQALRDIRATLHTLTPAEQLAGFDDAIRNLGGKIDMIVRTSGDGGAMQQLEGTLEALRDIVSRVASNEALARLSDDVHALAVRVEQLTPGDAFAGSLAALEQRIALLTTSLENRERSGDGGDGGNLERAVQALSDRIDHLQVGTDASAAFAHVEQRVAQLLERLEFADTRMAGFSRVEDGLSDVLRQLEQQRLSLAALGDHRATLPSSGMDPEVVEAIRRELSDLREGRAESDRNTQDALESVHSTLGHVVDRLAMIEGDLRESRAARAAAPAVDWPSAQTIMAAQGARGAPAPLVSSTALSAPMPPASRAAEPRPELPNPVAAAAPAAAPAPAAMATPGPPAALKDILIGAPREEIAPPQPPSPAAARESQPPRAPIDPSLPPDFPLEPGTRPQDRPMAAASPSERIAASEQVLSEIPAQPQGPVSTSSFIAAARRAAQAAAGAPPKDVGGEKPRHVSVLDAKGRQASANANAPSTITGKIRSLLVGASVVVIVLSGFKMAMTMLEGSGASAPVEQPAEPAQDKASDKASDRTNDKASDATPLPPAPSRDLTLPPITSPTPMERQSSAAAPTMPAAESRDAVPARPSDVTGAIPTPPVSAAPLPGGDRHAPTPAAPATLSPVSDALPDAIGGPLLRAAALRGDPTAAFEVASRYSDGRGVPVNYDEAIKWFERASDAGVVPAMFRLGTMYEKGLGGKKDVDAARRYYIRAAERGHAKAMHNLAVLDADGGARGPNYKSAAEWFRKAADHGVADSQFNLGILYARGIGVEQNLAESYKWFSLAAAQGDADAGRKRDDVAKRLDAQSLAAAKLAVQTFVVAPQPDDAVTVAAPAGGWDAMPAPSPKPAPRRGRVAAAAGQLAQAH